MPNNILKYWRQGAIHGHSPLSPFYLKRTSLCTFPFSFNYLLYSQSMTILLLSLILQIILHMILCANTHITKLLINGFGVIFWITERKLVNLQIICILTSFLVDSGKITLKRIFFYKNLLSSITSI